MSENAKKLLFQELETVPEGLCGEILDFVQFLKYKNNHDDNLFVLFASETALSKDWLTQEEEVAWQDL